MRCVMRGRSMPSCITSEFKPGDAVADLVFPCAFALSDDDKMTVSFEVDHEEAHVSFEIDDGGERAFACINDRQALDGLIVGLQAMSAAWKRHDA